MTRQRTTIIFFISVPRWDCEKRLYNSPKLRCDIRNPSLDGLEKRLLPDIGAGVLYIRDIPLEVTYCRSFIVMGFKKMIRQFHGADNGL